MTQLWNGMVKFKFCHEYLCRVAWPAPLASARMMDPPGVAWFKRPLWSLVPTRNLVYNWHVCREHSLYSLQRPPRKKLCIFFPERKNYLHFRHIIMVPSILPPHRSCNFGAFWTPNNPVYIERQRFPLSTQIHKFPQNDLGINEGKIQVHFTISLTVWQPFICSVTSLPGDQSAFMRKRQRYNRKDGG